jgi:hypothetical protein
MSKWPMRGHFRYLRFKNFPMTPRTPQCEVFFPLLSSSEHSGVPKDSKSPLFQVLGFTPTLDQVRVATFSIWYLVFYSQKRSFTMYIWQKHTYDMYQLHLQALINKLVRIPCTFKGGNLFGLEALYYRCILDGKNNLHPSMKYKPNLTKKTPLNLQVFSRHNDWLVTTWNNWYAESW